MNEAGMDYRIDDEPAALRAALREFLEQRMPDPAGEPDRVSRANAWRELARSEWLEHFASASVDGATASDWVGAMHVAEAFGAVPIPGPIDVVAGYLLPLATATGMAGVLERVRAGRLVTTPTPELAGARPDALPHWGQFRLSATRAGRRVRVDGTLRRVPSAGDAEAFVVPVELDGAPALVLVDREHPGVEVGEPSGVDVRRPVADVTLREVALERANVHVFTGLAAHERRCAIRHSLFLDAEAVGGGSEVIARTVAYCTDRTQFGRSIGSFQAIRHRLASAAAGVEGARSLAYRAAWDVGAGAASAPVDVVASRLWSSASYLAAAEAAVQCHGGMGFTWEQRVHLWYRAAVSGRGGIALAAAHEAISAHLGAGAAEAAVASTERKAS